MLFTCIDFETANHSDASICSAGVAVFDNGQLVESRDWLVRPPKGQGYFRPDFIDVHHLTWFDVKDAPEFPAIAPQLLERIARSDAVVAHNAQFDTAKLRGTLAHFGLACPEFPTLCTMRLARRVWPHLPHHTLDALCAHIGHEFKHHDAREDAEAAGRLLLAMMAQTGCATHTELLALQHGPRNAPAEAHERSQS